MARKQKYVPSQKCKQAIIFARVSSREQEQGASIDAQLESINNYCLRNNLNIIKTIPITESSTRGDRKKFHEMLDYVKNQKKKTAIVVHCIDRLQRGFNECLAIEQLLKEDKIEVHFYKEGLILHKDSASTDIMRWDMGILSAKMYIGAMKDNVKRSLDFNRKNGVWQSFAPIGYLNARNLDNKATIIIDEERAPMVKKLFTEYATGLHSLQSLAIMVKDMNLCSRQRKGVNIKPITRANIYNVLQNPFYYGYMSFEGNLIRHKYIELIDKATFDKVQTLLSGGEIIHARQSYATIPYAFRGLVRCSTCDCAITPETKTKKNGKQYTYLKCSHLKGNCKQGIVNENILFEQLNKEVFNNIKMPTKMIELLKANVRSHLDTESTLTASTKRNITNQLNQLESKEKKLFDFYLEDKIDKEVYEAKKSEIDIEKAELQKSSEKYVEINNEIKDTVESIIEIAANASILMKTNNPEQQRGLLGLLFEECYLDGKKLVYTLQKPFDKLLKAPNSKGWLAIEENNLSHIASLSNDVKQFKNTLQTD